MELESVATNSNMRKNEVDRTTSIEIPEMNQSANAPGNPFDNETAGRTAIVSQGNVNDLSTTQQIISAANSPPIPVRTSSKKYMRNEEQKSDHPTSQVRPQTLKITLNSTSCELNIDSDTIERSRPFNLVDAKTPMNSPVIMDASPVDKIEFEEVPVSKRKTSKFRSDSKKNSVSKSNENNTEIESKLVAVKSINYSSDNSRQTPRFPVTASSDDVTGSVHETDGTVCSIKPTARSEIKRNRTQERMNEILLSAIYESKPITEIKKLLDTGAEILARCRDSGATVLHLAALNSDSDMTEFLLSVGADLHARDKGGKQAVHIAAWEGSVSVLKVLCSYDSTMVSSRVAVEKPFCNKHPDSWNHKHDLINKYWQVMEVISEGSTPLHVACRRTKEAFVKFLIESGAKTSEEDSKGLYPVDVIGMNVSEDPINREASDSSEGSIVGIAKLLISYQKRNSSVTRTNGGSEGWLRVRRLFSVDDHDVRPVTALHTAVTENNLNLITILLDEGADVLVWNEDGQTPLHLAVKKKFLDALCLMLRHGDNKERRVVDAVDTHSRTLLHLAVEEEWTDGISILLEENADITCKSDQRQTVLHVIARKGNLKILTELLTVPESSTIINAIDNDCYAPIHRAVENNHLKSVELLFNNGSKADVLLPDGRTLLHMASQNNAVDLLEFLMNSTPVYRLKENKTSSGDGGMTALHIAASNGSCDIVEMLLKFNCDLAVKTSDSVGSTPLHLAAKHDRKEVISRILNYDYSGSTLEVADNHGWYPLHIAAGHGHEECVDVLLRSGADIALRVQDEQGTEFTGLDIIMTCVHRPVDFLVCVLDSYIIVDDKVPVTNPQCKVEVDFDFLLPKLEGKQLGVLEAVLNNGSDELEEAFFLHPIVQTFIYLKSKNMFFFFALFFDLFFLLAFYLSVIAYHGPFTLQQPIYRYILIGLLTINILVEVINVVRLQRYYLKDTETWIKWCVYLNIMFIVIHPTDLVLRYNMAVSILLAWTELLLIVSKYPAWGIYVLMFATVAGTVLKVLAVFSLLLIGFAFTFRALFQEKGPFNSVWASLVKVIIMVYELDYRGTMDEMNDEDDRFADIARTFYLLFVLMVSVSLVNLMLGLAVSDIAELKRKGRAKRLAKQVAFLGGLENLMYSWPVGSTSWARRHRSAPQGLVVKAGSSLSARGDSPLPRHLKEIVIDKARSVQQSNKSTPCMDTATSAKKDDRSSIGTRKSLSSTTYRFLS